MQPALDFLGWIRSGFSAGTLLTMVAMASGFAVTHGKQQQRMDDLERRIAVQETSGIRRGEFDAMLNQLRSMDGHLQEIERAVMEGRK